MHHAAAIVLRLRHGTLYGDVVETHFLYRRSWRSPTGTTGRRWWKPPSHFHLGTHDVDETLTAREGAK
jgi:hypothetical protein